jgi:hypothetical protein
MYSRRVPQRPIWLFSDGAVLSFSVDAYLQNSTLSWMDVDLLRKGDTWARYSLPFRNGLLQDEGSI